MLVNNSTWQQAGAATPAKLVVQNVGTARIAFVFAATAPAANAIALDSDEHGILNPGTEPMTVTGLDTDAKSMFVRALGPIDGKLFVDG